MSESEKHRELDFNISGSCLCWVVVGVCHSVAMALVNSFE